ncbi:hypothetical protein GIB67_008861 [Kingdonia uniflora]|uniref:Uncharacterized protein n=1 Tax=Kingdonia uniflora TaxID=39325 RepID=A0A7J7LVD0_9MAGN|nr:hypothetical protein GIB67_008861 [Kingdonia uniflora]
MGFVDFCSINAGNSDNRLIHVLVERWWLGFTPLDFVMLTCISFGRGHELPYDERYSKLKEATNMFPRITSNKYHSRLFKKVARAFESKSPQLRLRNGYYVCYLEALTDCDILGASSFDWGTPIMAALYRGLDEVSVLRPGKRYDRMEGQNQHRLATMAQVYQIETSRVDYMTYWRLVHPNPKIGYTLVKMTGNIWLVGRDLVRPDVILPPTSSLAPISQVQDYGVQETDDPCDMGWFMDVAGPNDQLRRIPIPVMQVPYPCPPAYSTDELWHQNQGLRYAAYEDSRQYVDRTTELEEQLRQRDEII